MSLERFQLALSQRGTTFDALGARRLFNGYTEGAPGMAVDLYGKTLVIHDALGPQGNRELDKAIEAHAKKLIPGIDTTLLKLRDSKDVPSRNGIFLSGSEKTACKKIKEHGVTYAIRLTMNRDTSFYLDTANLRLWAKENLKGKRVLNTFAYTGSLGLAAKAGGASNVVHIDMNNTFLTVAKDSCTLNGFEISKADFKAKDFFDATGELKRDNTLFDCVFIDPPYLSVTGQGKVDAEKDFLKIVNKVRPMVAHNGHLVCVNNAVFLSGADFMASLNAVCAGGYATIEQHIEVPLDFSGHPASKSGALPVDPAPFGHSTKISVLRFTRKDGRSQ
jgi:23S rRNA (cytosine1962-C5)-methyltransferase